MVVLEVDSSRSPWRSVSYWQLLRTVFFFLLHCLLSWAWPLDGTGEERAQVGKVIGWNREVDREVISGWLLYRASSYVCCRCKLPPSQP